MLPYFRKKYYYKSFTYQYSYLFFSKRLLKFIRSNLLLHGALSVFTPKFSSTLIIAKIFNIQKKERNEYITYYRPILILNVFRRFLTIIYDKVFEFLNKLNIISVDHHGFQQNKQHKQQLALHSNYHELLIVSTSLS